MVVKKPFAHKNVFVPESMNQNRFWELDFLRAIAVLMMVVFHFFWDINYFGIAEFDLYNGFLGAFQKTTAGLFLVLVGISLTISFNKSKNAFAAKFFKKSAKIFLFAFFLTFFSVAFFPRQPILFGILHLIALSIVLSIPFIRYKKASLALGLVFIFLPVFFDLPSLGINQLFFAGLSNQVPALDFFPVIPWFGAVLVGIFVGNTFYENNKPKIFIKKPENKIINAMEKLGQHSLLIYFIHQPIMFGLLFIAMNIFA